MLLRAGLRYFGAVPYRPVALIASICTGDRVSIPQKILTLQMPVAEPNDCA